MSFADGYPLLVISEASLSELNQRASEPPQFMQQFRPNIVVTGDEAFIEDSWKKIRIGEVEFDVVKPCERCILTTVDHTSGIAKASKEPLKHCLHSGRMKMAVCTLVRILSPLMKAQYPLTMLLKF